MAKTKIAPPPFRFVVPWGPKAVGKSLLILNSPWKPVHVIDTEYSTEEYYDNQDRLIKEGYFDAPFTRADAPNFEAVQDELKRIKEKNEHYGTLAIDTGGQFANWMRDVIWRDPKNASKVDKQSQVLWGMVRDRLRDISIGLRAHCDLLIFTAHSREYKDKKSARLNPAILEIAGAEIQMVRPPNSKLPQAQVKGRLPYFPPRIKDFTLSSLLDYVEKPADMDNLSEDQKVEEVVEVPEIPEGE
jgi:hypothetical protein